MVSLIFILFWYLSSNSFNCFVFVNMQYVMIVLKGSIPIAFGGTEQPAAYGELVSIGGLNPDVNKKLSAAIATILETKLSVPKSRFFLKFYDTKANYLNFLMKKGYICALLLSHCIFPFCLGTSISRICTVFACFTPELDHVNKSLLFKIISRDLVCIFGKKKKIHNPRPPPPKPPPKIKVHGNSWFMLYALTLDDNDALFIWQGSNFGWNGSTF